MTDYVPDFRPAAEGDDLPEEKTTIAAPQLAKLIGLDEALLGELANRARLPFAVSTEKGLHIVPGDLAAWLGARRRYAHWLDEIPEG